MREKTIVMIRFKSRKLTVQEYLDFSKVVLQTLQPLHPIFENLCSWGHKASHWTFLDKNLTNFDTIVFEHINDTDYTYINKDENDKKMHLDSYDSTGFLNSYSNTKKEKEGQVSVDIADGKGEGIGHINIEFPKVGYDEFYTESFCIQLLETLIKLTNAEYANVLTRPLRSNVAQLYGKFWIGWFTYFSNNGVYNHLPKVKTLQRSIINEGTLFWIDSTQPDNMDAYEIEQAKEIKKTLETSQLLENHYSFS
ncbi:hypothetical protein [Aquimarina aquimarini]|uniref:hypothetical protein n=1 Tax=Aquimarina aquimarini TaxID=1191734 RepID=UPI000D55CDF3|nr:hypothetical protein [Aquimarina aquimarini]